MQFKYAVPTGMTPKRFRYAVRWHQPAEQLPPSDWNDLTTGDPRTPEEAAIIACRLTFFRAGGVHEPVTLFVYIAPDNVHGVPNVHQTGSPISGSPILVHRFEMHATPSTEEPCESLSPT